MSWASSTNLPSTNISPPNASTKVLPRKAWKYGATERNQLMNCASGGIGMLAIFVDEDRFYPVAAGRYSRISAVMRCSLSDGLAVAPQHLHRCYRRERRGFGAQHPRSDVQRHPLRWVESLQIAFRLRSKQQLQRVTQGMREKRLETRDCNHLGNAVSATLFACGDDHIAPVRHTRVGAVARNSDD